MTWFKNWFGTHYYSLLYSHRDVDEAEKFIDTLTKYLKLPAGAKVLDAGCGRGRHAIHLADNGLDVVGIDISEKSIEEAKKFEHERLQFYMHDMRKLLPVNEFDAILNLFTSFGYFEDENDDIQILKNWCNSLKPKGKLVIDFLNPTKVLNELVAEEVVNKKDVKYFIKREIKNDFVLKYIKVVDENGEQNFLERVKLITLQDFHEYLTEARFGINEIFGNYKLQPYCLQTSDRLIIIAEKI